MRSKTFHPINQAVVLAIGLLVVQQLIVASSTIWITRLIAHIQEGHFVFYFLALYLAALLLPYFPGAAALVEMAKAKVRANVQFTKCFANNYRGQVVEWANSSHHTTKSSILTGEAPQTINGYLDFLYHFCSCSLSVVINLLVLAFIVEPLLLLSYAIGITFAFLILHFQKRWKRILSLRAQQGRIKWLSMLFNAWDNVLLGNRYNFGLWQNKTQQRAQRFTNSTIKLMGFSQGISVAMAFALLAPTFALVCYLAVVNAQNLTWLAMLVVVLPRLFQVLSYSYEMLFVLADFPMQKSRLQTVTKMLTAPENSEESLEKRIQWEKIQVVCADKNRMVAKELLSALPTKGRLTLQGENGSGKTSLLLLVKMVQKESAFYLPPKHGLEFVGIKDGLSTGQLACTILQEFADKVTTPIILLDEWDANLDSKNMKKLSKVIDKLASKGIVIESRHRISQ